jgi:hypothetical protein
MPLTATVIKWRFTTAVCTPHICTSLQKKLDNSFASTPTRIMERRIAQLILALHNSTGTHKELGNRFVFPSARGMQGRIAVYVCTVYIGAVV